MNHKSWKVLAAVIAFPVCLAAACYVGIGFYYSSTFAVQTYINGIYATGQTVGRMEAAIKEPEDEYVLKITDPDGSTEEIRGGDIGMRVHYEESLQELLNGQKKFLWGLQWANPSYHEIEGRIQFDRDRAVEAVKGLDVYQRASVRKNPEIKILKGENGYTLKDDTEGAVDTEKLVNLVLKALAAGERELSLAQEDCFKEYQLSSQMQKTRGLFQQIEKIQGTHIVYSTGSKKLELKKNEAADFIAVDEQGNFILDSLGCLTVDEAKIEEFVVRLSDEFDTLGKDIEWKKSGGGSVSVNNATFGCAVDREAEIQQVAASVLNGIDQEREPFFLPAKADIGTGEIGSTYIEVDMSKQMLYYYTDGVLYLKTDVVTGATNRGRGTPEKVCYVYGKQRNRTLRGADYAAFVNYWMPVYGNIGLHDAKWRKEFGGDIYKNGGSHGCINLPKEAAEKIFDKVEVGTPVVMYY